MKTYLIVFLICSFSISYGETLFNDGYEHDIDYTIEDYVYIQNDPFWGYPTTVNVLERGHITMATTIREDSNLNIIGGKVESIFGRDNSKVVVKDGEVTGVISLYIDANLIIEGGVSDVYIILRHSSSLSIYNGLLTAESISIEDSSSMTIYGTNFSINGRPVQSGTYTDCSGVLTGTLIGGDAIDIPFRVCTTVGSLILSPESIPFCTEYPTMDFNRDCKIDLIDFTEFASQWMTCNLEPQSFCW